MSVFVIAQLKFFNEAAYRKYQDRFFDVFNKFSGQILAADESPVVLEGNWSGDKVVLMSFPDEQQAHNFLGSAEYLEISHDRKSGAETVALQIQGLL